MAVNPLLAASVTASPSRACLEKKAPAGTSGFQSLLRSLSAPQGQAAASPKAAAELLRIEMMRSTLALGGDQPDAPSPQSVLLGTLPVGFDKLGGGTGVPVTTASLETAEAQEWEQSRAGQPLVEAEADEIAQTAEGYLGTPYRFGGEGTDGIDCSSFVQHVFHAHSIDLPRTAREQIGVGSDVAPGDLRKGDLVFFQTYASYPSHVGIYLGDGKMIHASSGRGAVTISDMNSDYYSSRYLGAKRII